MSTVAGIRTLTDEIEAVKARLAEVGAELAPVQALINEQTTLSRHLIDLANDRAVAFGTGARAGLTAGDLLALAPDLDPEVAERIAAVGEAEREAERDYLRDQPRRKRGRPPKVELGQPRGTR